MTALDRQARLAGFLYLLICLVGPLRLIYIPSTLFVSGHPAETAANIAAHETLFRWGMAGDLFIGTVLIFVVLALYRLFKPTGPTLAGLVVILGGLLPSAIHFINIANDAAALILVKGAPFLDAFTQPQRESLAMLFLRVHREVITAAETLWGLWLIPLALLVWRCGFLPRMLAVWLVLNGLAYIAQSVAGFVMPQLSDSLDGICFPLQLGEIAFMLWLLAFGARRNILMNLPKSM
ncbi:hypothetical protein BJI69_00920 [Luteibacter rhizovicinus DSM 16549]|uniref:DUF4386 domain-containing protein n=1 Tax=Luteibacter rhizovicinus DSM 16549 TaxID=1440763 RepID=A0A1L3EYZ3_9GAMM|nr:DUF4386 domain-containing protein [Luteibacter rhizovicinus]APG06281.1 hypothetical protein BJI69_00920 [Luteibacter rhizovicinus DSM 16549]KLD78269.1 hypothetical protein Y886_11140 [Xanthomonas hyacinthi DSM 19077]